MAEMHDTTEEYLETILELEEENIVPLRARISERLGHSGPTVSQTVGRMERDGLVARTPNTDDRRMRAVSLTPRGSALLREILPEHFRRMAWLMATLDEQERVTLVRLLGKVMQRASEEEESPVRAPDAPLPAA